MDTTFFSKYLLAIARNRHSKLLFATEQLYYRRYISRLSYNIRYLETKDINNAISYVNNFENSQRKRVKNSIFVKPKRMLEFACEDTRDVLQGMWRWDGVGIENEKWAMDNWKVNFDMKGIG